MNSCVWSLKASSLPQWSSKEEAAAPPEVSEWWYLSFVPAAFFLPLLLWIRAVIIEHKLCKHHSSLDNSSVMSSTLAALDGERLISNSASLKNKHNFHVLPQSHPPDFKRTGSNSQNVVGCAFTCRRCALKSYCKGKNTSLAHLHGSSGSHLFPLQNVPAGQSHGRCGTRDGFMFHFGRFISVLTLWVSGCGWQDEEFLLLNNRCSLRLYPEEHANEEWLHKTMLISSSS